MPISIMSKFKIFQLKSNYIKTLVLTNIYNYYLAINTSFRHYMSMEIIGKIYPKNLKIQNMQTTSIKYLDHHYFTLEIIKNDLERYFLYIKINEKFY